MKNLLIVLLLGLFVSVNAQTEYFETDIRGIRTDIREVAKEVVAENMELTPEQAEIFWPLYDEYMAEVALLGDQEVKLTEEYMLNFYLMEEETAGNLLEKVLNLERDKQSLKSEYIRKMKKVLPAKVVGKFYQIERRLSILIDAEKVSRIPLLKKEEK
jgi:predicted Zn-dependent peptidase